jgi:hypothetical protein
LYRFFNGMPGVSFAFFPMRRIIAHCEKRLNDRLLARSSFKLKLAGATESDSNQRDVPRAPNVPIRVTPAMAAGVTDKLCEIADIVARIEAKEAEKPTARGPYKKRAT